MQEQFDKYAAQYANFVTTGQAAATMLWSVDTLQYAQDGGSVEVLAAEKKKRKEVFDGVEVAARKGVVTNREGSGKAGAGGSKVANHTDTRSSPTEPIPAASGPQFRYQTPVEDPKLAKSVLERALDSKIELSQRELLALSPDVRKQIKEMTTTKRVAAGIYAEDTKDREEVALLGEVHDARDQEMEEVAAESVALRCLDVLMEGNVTTNCILDQGCQIIAISKAVWEALGVPVLNERQISMTAANGTVERSIGLIPRLKLQFGPVEMVVQAHVMNNAPFNVLLGRPFFQAGRCRTTDFANGEQHITLTDPRTKADVTIPTHARSREGFHASRN